MALYGGYNDVTGVAPTSNLPAMKQAYGLSALLASLPEVDVASPGIWNDGGELKVGSAT